MQAEYLHCKRINSQILVTLNNPETAEKAKYVVDSILHCQCFHYAALMTSFTNELRQIAMLIMLA